MLTEDDTDEIREQIIAALAQAPEQLTLTALQHKQQLIQQQFDQWFGKKDGLEIWQGMHIQHAEHIPMLSAAAVIQIKQGVGYGN